MQSLLCSTQVEMSLWSTPQHLRSCCKGQQEINGLFKLSGMTFGFWQVLHLSLRAPAGSGGAFSMLFSTCKNDWSNLQGSNLIRLDGAFQTSTPCYLWFLIWGPWRTFTSFCGGWRITSTPVGAGRCGEFFFPSNSSQPDEAINPQYWSLGRLNIVVPLEVILIHVCLKCSFIQFTGFPFYF